MRLSYQREKTRNLVINPAALGKAARAPEARAQWITMGKKFGHLCIQEILVVTKSSVRAYIIPFILVALDKYS